MSDKDEILAQFIEVSGCDENVAEFYLSSSNWSLEDALSTFLGTQNDNDNNEMSSEATGNIPSANIASTNSLAPKLATSSDAFTRTSAPKPKFATLNDMTKMATDDDEEQGQAFYAGGSDRSGQQVLGPPKRKNFREQLTDMFRMAQEHSSQEPQPMPSTSAGASIWGQGVRLGMTENDHNVIQSKSGENKAVESGGEKKPIVVLKLWSQGFSIDDGELRPYDDPENKEFLETVMRGEIPQELLNMGWMFNVDVEDHRHEDFKKKSTTVKTFKGSGHTLGSPVPNIEEEPQTTKNESTEENTTDAAKCEEVATEKLKLNAAEPTTTLQIRLADGTRLSAQFNLTHTVADIQQFIQNARPQYVNRNFILISTFPTRELKNLELTIDKAGLKNASIMQRLT